MSQFKQSLIRGTQSQANENPNKATYLAEYLQSSGVKDMQELNEGQMTDLNVAICGIDAREVIEVKSDLTAWIENERVKGRSID